jgi:hypothetical protein
MVMVGEGYPVAPGRWRVTEAAVMALGAGSAAWVPGGGQLAPLGRCG